jgi:hypothetical protein
MQYFNLTFPNSERLWADHNRDSLDRLRIPCPVSSEHLGVSRRIGPLNLEVKHNHRDEMMIWTWSVGVHQLVLDEIQKEGFTGFRLRPAIVRFKDGSISNEYQELVVTGWAGVVSLESGMRLKYSCPVCQYRSYSAITNYDKVIDWDKWSGEDFFFVYPFLGRILCTERVVKWLRRQKVKSFRVEEGFAERKRDSIISKMGMTAGQLSNILPDDLAIKYSQQIGLKSEWAGGPGLTNP